MSEGASVAPIIREIQTSDHLLGTYISQTSYAEEVVHPPIRSALRAALINALRPFTYICHRGEDF